MEAIDVIFSGTPQQFADSVNSLVDSRLLPKTGKIVFDVWWEDRNVKIRVQTPEDIEHAGGVSIRGSYIARIEAHTIPTGTWVTLLETGFAPEHWEAARRCWEVLLARLRLEGWQVREVDAEPAQAERDQDAPKIEAPRHSDTKRLDQGSMIPEALRDVAEMRKHHPDYSLATALEIARVLPKAWQNWENDTRGLRWGSSSIAPFAGLTNAVVSRYLSAWRKAGITEVSGVHIPQAYGTPPN